MSPIPSPLAAVHARLGATTTAFAGWEMPLRYGSELAEHRAVRESVGLFDLSHMGEVLVSGAEAGAYLDQALSRAVSGIDPGRAAYALLLADDGGIIDDLVVYRTGDAEFLLVVNAANRETDVAALQGRAHGFDVSIEDRTDDVALVAVQGPRAADLVGALLRERGGEGEADAALALRNYRSTAAVVDGHETLVARTGYTGEDGFELYVPTAGGVALWEALEAVAAAEGIEAVPCGLAARDTLRLEAGMPLYGNELSRSVRPAQAGLGRVAKPDAERDYVGREALAAGADEVRPVLVGLVSEGRRAGRSGSAVQRPGGEPLGEVTSGALSPTLGHPIALALVDPSVAEPGTGLAIDVRGRELPATVVALPFYSRAR
jgi:aminomethyltransferase